MGFIPIPLSVLVIRVISQAIDFTTPGTFILVIAAYLTLLTFRILNSIVILGKACDLLNSHKKVEDEKPLSKSQPASRQSSMVDLRTYMGERSQSVHVSRSNSEDDMFDYTSNAIGHQPLFTNSNVNITDQELNEEILAQIHKDTVDGLVKDEVDASKSAIEDNCSSQPQMCDSDKTSESTVKSGEADFVLGSKVLNISPELKSSPKHSSSPKHNFDEKVIFCSNVPILKDPENEGKS